MAAMAHSTVPTGDALAFLQRRVGWFALVAGGLTLAFLAFRAAGEPHVDALLDPSMLTTRAPACASCSPGWRCAAAHAPRA